MKRDTLVLIIAVACGLAAFGLIFNFLKQASIPPAQIVVAKAGVPKGKVLTAEDLTISAPIKNVAREKYFTQINDLIGMRAENDIPAGGMIDRGIVKKFQAAIAQIVPQAKVEQDLPVPPSMRALTLGAQDLDNIPNALSPGDYVDILGNVVLNNNEREVRTILYAVSVIGIQRLPGQPVPANVPQGTLVSGARGPVERVTIALLPAQVETVLNASRLGKMRVVINSREGNQSAWANVGSIEIIRGVTKERKST